MMRSGALLEMAELGRMLVRPELNLITAYPSVMVRCAETEFDTARMRTDLTRDLATERQGIEGHR
jgi:hypothetical protein